MTITGTSLELVLTIDFKPPKITKEVITDKIIPKTSFQLKSPIFEIEFEGFTTLTNVSVSWLAVKLVVHQINQQPRTILP